MEAFSDDVPPPLVKRAREQKGEGNSDKARVDEEGRGGGGYNEIRSNPDTIMFQSKRLSSTLPLNKCATGSSHFSVSAYSRSQEILGCYLHLGLPFISPRF